MRWRPWLLYIGVLIFLGSALLVLRSVEGEPSPSSLWLAVAGAGGMLVAAGFFIASVFAQRRGVDWRRIQAEQRLWESGPLGRSWLRIRQRLSRLWKL